MADIASIDRELRALGKHRMELRKELAGRLRPETIIDGVRQALAHGPLHYREIAQMAGLSAEGVASKIHHYRDEFRRLRPGVYELRTPENE